MFQAGFAGINSEWWHFDCGDRVLVRLPNSIDYATAFLGTLKRGAIAGPNPWGASTLEWSTQSPPLTENFTETPEVVHEPYEALTVDIDEAHQGAVMEALGRRKAEMKDMAKKVRKLPAGEHVPVPKGMVFMNRLQFGFYSVWHGFADREFTGKVTRVNPAANITTRQVEVLVSFDDARQQPNVAGLYAEGRVETRSSAALALPAASLVREGDNTFAWRVKDGEVKKVPITLGARDFELKPTAAAALPIEAIQPPLRRQPRRTLE